MFFDVDAGAAARAAPGAASREAGQPAWPAILNEMIKLDPAKPDDNEQGMLRAACPQRRPREPDLAGLRLAHARRRRAQRQEPALQPQADQGALRLLGRGGRGPHPLGADRQGGGRRGGQGRHGEEDRGGVRVRPERPRGPGRLDPRDPLLRGPAARPRWAPALVQDPSCDRAPRAAPSATGRWPAEGRRRGRGDGPTPTEATAAAATAAAATAAEVSAAEAPGAAPHCRRRY